MMTVSERPAVDEILASHVSGALLDLQSLPLLALPRIDVAVQNGHVKLEGNVATASLARALRDRARQIPGVTDVTNRIVDDGSLTVAVWSALVHEPLMRGADRRIRIVLGTVYIDWAGRNQERELRAETLIRRVPGVQGVIHCDWTE